MEFGDSILLATRIGITEGVRFALLATGVSIVWRVGRIPDLSAYATYIVASALAGWIFRSGSPAVVGYGLALGVGLLVGVTVFALWRLARLNILIVGILLNFVGFSVAAFILGFEATAKTSGWHASDAASTWATSPTAIHGLLLLLTFSLFCVLFQTGQGTMLYVWARSKPLAAELRKYRLSSPEMATLVIGSVCIALSAYVRAQDHGEISLNEGKELLFITLAMLVLGETVVGLTRQGFRSIAARHIRLVRRHLGFLPPMWLLAAAPVGAVAYWILVNLSDEILRAWATWRGEDIDLSALSQGLVAVLAGICLLLMHAKRGKDELNEAWRFQS